MRLARLTAKTLLALLSVCDVLFAWELWRHGSQMVTSEWKEIQPGEVSFRMTRFPATAHDYAVLAFFIALQVAFIGFLWLSRERVARD